MKRFFQEARAAEVEGGHGILLDGRPLRTPARAPLVLPRRALAEAIAGEWQAQSADIRPHSMPLMRLASTAIDRVAAQREAVIDEAAGYAATDLVCYRAERPVALVARQQALWQPLVDWATLTFDAPLAVFTGVVPQPQPPAALQALRAAVAGQDDLRLATLHAATTTSGSLVIGLALLEQRLDAAGAWDAAELDETFQIEQWGEDAEQAKRRAALRRDLEDIARFMALLRDEGA